MRPANHARGIDGFHPPPTIQVVQRVGPRSTSRTQWIDPVAPHRTNEAGHPCVTHVDKSIPAAIGPTAAARADHDSRVAQRERHPWVFHDPVKNSSSQCSARCHRPGGRRLPSPAGSSTSTRACTPTRAATATCSRGGSACSPRPTPPADRSQAPGPHRGPAPPGRRITRSYPDDLGEDGAADESGCTPGSVPRVPRGARGDGHPSRTGVAAGLVRSTRGLGRAALERPRRALFTALLLTLLRVGFT